MNSRILIGNLSTDVKEVQIVELFTGTSAKLLTVMIPEDPRTGKCRGYAFVEMANEKEARQAVSDLNGQSVDGRKIAMSLVETKPKRKWYNL